MSAARFLVPPNDPILKMSAARVEPGDDLAETMRIMKFVCERNKVRGAGLAAPQIGVSKRLICVMGTHGWMFMINPGLCDRSGKTTLFNEGCLTYPDVHKVIARDTWVQVDYEDTRRIKNSRIYFEGWTARVIQHEIDHLNGICRVGDDSPPDGEIPPKPEAKKIGGRGAILMVAAVAAMGMSRR